jgi:tetratricopeptide (TPR) repeat protein
VGLQIGGGRRKRRSYADYRAPVRGPVRRSDPFRVVFYLAVIAAGVWIITHPEIVTNRIQAEIDENAPAIVLGSTAVPTQETDYAAEAKLAEGAGLLEDAIEAYHQAGAASPNTVEYPFEEARLLIYLSALQYGEQHDETLVDALDAANRAILADPADARGYAILGKVKDWQGKPESGINDIQRALEIHPDLAVAHSYMAEVLIDLDRWDEAQNTAGRAMQLDPNSADVRRDFGYVMESLGDYATAQTHYEAALQLAPNNPALKMSLGRIYRVNGLFDQALDEFFAVQTLYPQNALIPYELGRTYETYIGDPVSAIESYDAASQLDSKYPSPLIRLGTLYFGQANYADAITTFEKVIELGIEDNVDVLYQLGLSYANTGECAKAIPMLNQARTLAEEDERIVDLVNSGFETCSQPTPTSGPSPSATP